MRDPSVPRVSQEIAGEVRVLTIRQPWSSLIAAGVKTIETRSWSTNYRGPLLIHAGKAKPDMAWEGGGWAIGGECWQDGVRWFAYRGIFANSIDLPLGAVVAVADLVDVVRIDRWAPCPHVGDYPHDGPLPHQQGGLWLIGVTDRTHGTPTPIEDQRPFGDFTPGRYAWLLDNIRPVDPIPAKGRQGLWRPDAELIEAAGVLS